MTFPSKKDLRAVRRRLSKVEGSLMRPMNLTPLEKFRYDIQQCFVKFKIEHEVTQKAMAEIIGIDESKMSKILHNRLEEFSTDRMIAFYEKLNPKVKLEVS